MFFRLHFSIWGDTLEREFLQVDTVSFAVVPGIIVLNPWSFGVGGVRPPSLFPEVTGNPQLVELPQLIMEVQVRASLGL